MARIVEETLPAGTWLEDLQIVSVLGQGGFGVTYLARSSALEGDVVVKEYFPQSYAHRDGNGGVGPSRPGVMDAYFQDGLRRFGEEARALARLTRREGSRGITPILRFFEANGTSYYVMTYMRGRTLNDWISDEGPLPSETVRGLADGILDALEQVHNEGLLHRDLTTNNVFVRSDGVPVLIDFGLVRMMAGPRRSRFAVGTPGFAAPEQHDLSSEQTPATDFYGLAATLYTALCGSPPPAAISRAVRDDLEPIGDRVGGSLDPNLARFIDRALVLDPGGRPSSVAECRSLLSGSRERGPRPELDALDQAYAKIQSGKYHEARAILDAALEDYPDSSALLAFACLEYGRAPVDSKKSVTLGNECTNNYGSTPEAIALQILWSLQWGSGEQVAHDLDKLTMAEPPTDRHTAYIVALVEVLAIDQRIQSEILKESHWPIVTPILVGAAYLIQGAPHSARSTFDDCLASPGKSLKPYKRIVPRLSAEQRDRIKRRIEEASLLGKALALRDLGRGDLALPLWEELRTLRPAWPSGSEFLINEARVEAAGVADIPSSQVRDRSDKGEQADRAWGTPIIREARNLRFAKTKLLLGGLAAYAGWVLQWAVIALIGAGGITLWKYFTE